MSWRLQRAGRPRIRQSRETPVESIHRRGAGSRGERRAGRIRPGEVQRVATTRNAPTKAKARRRTRGRVADGVIRRGTPGCRLPRAVATIADAVVSATAHDTATA